MAALDPFTSRTPGTMNLADPFSADAQPSGAGGAGHSALDRVQRVRRLAQLRDERRVFHTREADLLAWIQDMQATSRPRLETHLRDLHDLLPDDSGRALAILRSTRSSRSRSPSPERPAVGYDTDAQDSPPPRRRQRHRHVTPSAQCALPGSWRGQLLLELAREVTHSPWPQWSSTAG